MSKEKREDESRSDDQRIRHFNERFVELPFKTIFEKFVQMKEDTSHEEENTHQEIPIHARVVKHHEYHEPARRVVFKNLRELSDSYRLLECIADRKPRRLKRIILREKIDVFRIDINRSTPACSLEPLLRMPVLEYLDLSGSPNLLDGMPATLWVLKSLKVLKVCGCKNLTTFQSEVDGDESLGFLHTLDVSNCINLKELPKPETIPGLLYFSMRACTEIEKLPCYDDIRRIDMREVEESKCRRLLLESPILDFSTQRIEDNLARNLAKSRRDLKSGTKHTIHGDTSTRKHFMGGVGVSISVALIEAGPHHLLAENADAYKSEDPGTCIRA